MLGRYRPQKLALGALALGLFIIAALPLCVSLADIRFSRNDVKQGSQCQNGDAARCVQESNQADIRTAAAAEQTADLALIQGFLNLLGLCGLGATIFFAGKAWAEAKRSADADNEALVATQQGLLQAREDAKEQASRAAEQLAVANLTAKAAGRQADIAEANARVQLRAYLFVDKLTFDWNEEEPIFIATLRNVGTTPAIDVEAGGVIFVGGYPDATKARMPAVVTAWEAPVGGGSSYETVLIVYDKVKVKKSDVSYKMPMIVLGVLKYKDVFGDNYETEFGFYVGRNECPESGMSTIPRHGGAFKKKN